MSVKTVSKGDRYYLNDRVKVTLSKLQTSLSVSDSLSLRDSLVLISQNIEVLADDLLFFDDSFSANLLEALILYLSDNLLLTDFFSSNFFGNPVFTDSVNLSDVISLILLNSALVADTFTLVDTIMLNLSNNESDQALFDSLSFSDNVEINLDLGLDTYLRRYLNDNS